MIKLSVAMLKLHSNSTQNKTYIINSAYDGRIIEPPQTIRYGNLLLL